MEVWNFVESRALIHTIKMIVHQTPAALSFGLGMFLLKV